MEQLSFKDIDGLGRGLYAATRLNPNEPPKRGTFEVAERLLGKKVVYEVPRAMERGARAIVNGRQIIAIRKGESAARANFFVGEQVSRVFLEEQSWFRGLSTIEQRNIGMRVGGWIAAPLPALEAQIASVGLDVPKLSATFAMTNTGIVLLAAEAGIVSDSAVVSSERVYRRGARFSNFSDDMFRELAKKKGAKTVRRIAMHDEGERVGLLAVAS